MGAIEVKRPVWRKFDAKQLADAARHVRRGGHAAIVDKKKLSMLLTTDKKGKITELGFWAVLTIEQERWQKVKDGDAKGLAVAKVKKDFHEAVLDWCHRDIIHKGAKRKVKLDCLECGSCCHESNVVLYDEDFDRFREGGREDLIHRDYIKKKKDGQIVLRFLKKDDGRCQHLHKKSLKCGIYKIRPYNCRVFPVGSEACLSARESTRDWRDGLPVA